MLRRRTPLARAAGRLVLVALLAAAASGCGEPAESPPVLVYLVDTLRPDHLSVYGYPRATSPYLNVFAADAVVFENAYAPTSWTKPSTASLLTGLEPAHHGVTRSAHVVAPESRMLAERLAEVGYQTAAFSANPWILPEWGFAQGFDHFQSLGPMPGADVMVDAVLAQLAARTGAPFFYYVHAIDPHGPYRPPAHRKVPWLRTGTVAANPRDLGPDTPRALLEDTVSAYDAEIAFGDEHFGRLLRKLMEAGLYERALIVFTSDHGEQFVEHGLGGHGRTLFQEVVRVPLLVKFPGNRHGGRRVADTVSLIDVVPTVLAAVGQPIDERLDGIDLLAALDGADPVDPGRELFFDLDLLHGAGTRNRARGMLADGMKYLAMEVPAERRLLFDLGRDPGEQHDLSKQRPVLVARLAETLARHAAEGTEGFHLALVNGPERSPAPRRLRGRLRVEGGRITVLAPQHLEEGDRVEVSSDRKEIAFDVVLRNFPGTFEPVVWQVDEDWLRFEVKPSEARITLVELTAPGEDEPALHVGPDRRAVAARPYTFSLAERSLWTRSLSELIPAGSNARGAVAFGAYLVAMPPAVERSLGSLDSRERERLRALGYATE